MPRQRQRPEERDIPIREHLRRRGVEATESGAESEQPDQGVNQSGPVARRKRKRGGWFPEGGPQAPKPESAEPSFWDTIGVNTDVPHEVKAKITDLYNIADSGNADSIYNLHKAIYDSGLPGELKDKLASMRSYSPADNRNANPARRNVPDVSGVGPTSSVDPRTGQPWDRNVGPSIRARILEKIAQEQEARSGGKPPQPSIGGGPAPAPPGGRGPQSYPTLPTSGGSGDQAPPGFDIRQFAEPPVSAPGAYGPTPNGAVKPSPYPGDNLSRPPQGNPYGIPPQILQFLMSLRQQGRG